MTPQALPAADPFISLRLFSHHKHDVLLDDLLQEIAKYPGCCDELWFATEYGFPPLRVHEESAAAMVRSAEKVLAAGLVPSFQISNCLGHGKVDCLDYAGVNWRKMVGHNGVESAYCGCPLSEDLQTYLTESTRAYAACKPGSVWIDDDLRMGNHGNVRYGCFCGHCLKVFSQAQGKAWGREELVAALGSCEGGTLRVAWMGFNQKRSAELAEVISNAVHEVSPDTMIALQHAASGYNGVDQGAILKCLAVQGNGLTGSRPGGGFYTDHRPREMLDKAFGIAEQIEELPEGGVSVIRPEVENFTHTAMGKTPHGTLVESTLDIAVGCNGISYATLMLEQETMDQYGLLLKRTAAWRPFMLDLANACAGTLPGGLALAFSLNHADRTLREGEDVWAGGVFSCSSSRQHGLATLGLPLSMSRNGACGTLLIAEAIDGFTDGELRDILRGAVMMDGRALVRLEERGFADVIGVTTETVDCYDSFEFLSDDAINGDYKGARWIQWLFNGQIPVYRLIPTTEKVRVLGRYRLHNGSVDTGIASVAVENRLGGRTAIFGYNGSETIVNSARRAQLLGAANWITKGTLPVIIETPAQVVVLPRVSAEGGLEVVTLLNVTIDHTEPLVIHLQQASGKKVNWHTHEGQVQALPGSESNGVLTVTIPSMGAWCIGFLEIN